jgi:hypothetical protein
MTETSSAPEIAGIVAAAREQCERDGQGDLQLTIADCARALQLFARQQKEAA